MRGPKAVCIELAADGRAALGPRARPRITLGGDAMRAAIVLLAASGMANLAIAKRLRTTRVTVATWRQRFACRRMDGLSDEPRPGTPRKLGDDKITEVVTAKLETMPTAATHWSTRSMAKASGLSVSSVHRIWLSTDLLFVEKIRDIVGLYLDTPDRALVLCIDEKSLIEVLDRTQRLLGVRPGGVERHIHDYARHWTTSLFAALDVKAGTMIGKYVSRHGAPEFAGSLNRHLHHCP